ncbi:MAG TPA: hypothetical protein VK484_02135 [Ferruginibacter sp.]|nr:hypothetical protein [Ferruginibacter sp.]
MKRFGSLFLAAVLGSVCTIASFQFLGENESVAKLDYLSGVPASKVAYRVDENGKTIPLDFTAAAEKVMPAVVYIRSTQDNNSSRGEKLNLWTHSMNFLPPPRNEDRAKVPALV